MSLNLQRPWFRHVGRILIVALFNLLFQHASRLRAAPVSGCVPPAASRQPQALLPSSALNQRASELQRILAGISEDSGQELNRGIPGGQRIIQSAPSRAGNSLDRASVFGWCYAIELRGMVRHLLGSRWKRV